MTGSTHARSSFGESQVGRRFFIFPNLSLKDQQVADLRRELMQRAGRSLVLVPSDRLREEIAKDVEKSLGFRTFSAEDIEASKKPFVAEENAVAVVANRYDGIDFPGDECRLLFIEGHPKATNIQERFLMARMGASILFNERVQTRILQAIGRCTRSLEDYSAVVVSGEELPDYLADIRRRRFLHPELQAEISFGVEQSKGTSKEDLVENFEIFSENGAAWESVNEQIVSARKAMVQATFPALANLGAAVPHEIAFQTLLWQGDYEGALASAESVLGQLDAPELRGYLALWHYLAGAAAKLGADAGVDALLPKARMQFDRAKGVATGIPWLVRLARYQSAEAPDPEADRDAAVLMEQIERVEYVLAQLGTVHDRSFAKREKDILDGLASSGNFEEAQTLLGEMVGFETGKVEAEGSPDPWWIAGNLCFVFEDHAGASENSLVDVTKARQAASHPAWMAANVPSCKGAEVLPVLITPVTKIRSAAVPFLADVALWRVKDLRQWAECALATVRELRKTFAEPGNLIWRAKAAELFNQHTLAAPMLFRELRSRPASKHLTPVD